MTEPAAIELVGQVSDPARPTRLATADGRVVAGCGLGGVYQWLHP